MEEEEVVARALDPLVSGTYGPRPLTEIARAAIAALDSHRTRFGLDTTVERLTQMIQERDEFLVSKGMFEEFASALIATDREKR